MSTVSETISKKKQGRPKGYAALALQNELRTCPPDGGHRTQVNHVFMLEVFCLVRSADESVQRTVWGCTTSEIASGTARFPKGWMTFTPEIGRYLATAGDDEQQNVLRIIVNARERGFSWSDIAAHFRTLRLGEKAGNKSALVASICRALDQFRKQFPKTSNSVIVSALQDVLFVVEQTVGSEDEVQQ